MEQHKIEQILEQTNIVDVIREYIPLKRFGSNYKARCPFHEEKTASFVVSEKKQIFKCFGCGKAGNAITFVRDYEKLSYIEAVKKLAESLGIMFTETVKREGDSKQTLLYQVYSLANAFFQENLQEYGKKALQYLLDRKIPEEVIKEFEIGYALNSYSGLANYLVKNDINEKILIESGLFSNSKNGLVDSFRDRIMFPIHSSSGKVVAFGGRIMETRENTGKYINSPTTKLYTKGNELYGLHRTRYDISKQNYALICEGYLDFLRLYEQGFTNSVASLGTALTDKQIQLLSRYTEHFYLLYDGDAAGEKAAVKAAGEIIKHGFDAKIISLPNSEDPDSFLLQEGKAALEILIEKAKSLPEYIVTNSSLEWTEKEKITFLIETANEINDQIAKELLINQVADMFHLTKASIHSQLKKRFAKKQEKKEISIPKFIEERNLLIMMLHQSEIHKKVAESLSSDYFLSELFKNIFENMLYQIYENMKEASILELFESDEEKDEVAKLLWEEIPQTTETEMIRDIKIRKYRHDLTLLDKKLVEGHEKQTILLEKKKVIEKMRKLAGNKVVQKTLF
jgi:DNA primase